MKYVNLVAERVTQGPGIVGMLKHIELCGRVCYHSESKITDTSYIKFVDMQIRDHHFSPLEHGSVYLTIPNGVDDALTDFFISDTYSFAVTTGDNAYVTTNYRVIVENGLEERMQQFWSEPTTQHMPRPTFRAVWNIAGYKDGTRHRSISPLVESTRFCAYNKDKFDNNVKYILYPATKPEDMEEWTNDLITIESIYMKWLSKGYTPQDASQFLPQQTAAMTYWTAFLPDWEHFLFLRYYEMTGPVRPEVKEIASQIYDNLVKEFPDYEF